MLKIAVIGGAETVMGFKALGLETYPAADPAEASKILRHLTRDNDDYAIIYIIKYSFYLVNAINGLRIWIGMSRDAAEKPAEEKLQ